MHKIINPLSFEDLSKRWTGIGPEQMNTLLAANQLQPYSVIKKSIDAKGKVTAHCNKVMAGQYACIPLGLDGTVFDPFNVVMIEEAHPDFLTTDNSGTWPNVCEDGANSIAPAQPVHLANEAIIRPRKANKTNRTISQKQAAALCGVSLRTFQYWEKGDRPPPDGFPTRNDYGAFMAWAHQIQYARRLKQRVVAMNSARPMAPDDIDRCDPESAW